MNSRDIVFLLSLKTPLPYVWVSPDVCQQEFLQEIASQPSWCYLYDKMGHMLMIEGNRSRGSSNARPRPSTPREEAFNKCFNTTSGHRHTTEALLQVDRVCEIPGVRVYECSVIQDNAKLLSNILVLCSQLHIFNNIWCLLSDFSKW